MSVTNYTPDQCRYLLSKLENIVYLVSEDALKDIKIDNGSAYVTSIDESPLSIKCYNLKLTEDETLDERYKFAHTVTFSVNGYMNKDNFNDRYYVILKDKEGTYWLVNPLFPSKVTYIYTLGDMQNHTDFTLATVSNHPVLRLNEFTVSDSNECESYWLDGVEGLRLNEKKYSAHIDNHINYTNPGGFSDIHFNEKSCTITETFDGEKVSHQIDFNILLSQYKNDWHYSLLEFTDNIYAAVFKTLNGKYGLCGFSMGLQPSFTINGESQTTNNYIKISLVDAHTDGLTLDFFDEVYYEYLPFKSWAYTADYGGYECVGEGIAKYLLKKEIDALDNETGNYMVLDGYESYFQESSWPVFHIVDTFDETETFNNIECNGSSCKINTSLPSSIEFNTVDCQTYYINSYTDWTITSSKSHITVSPSNGVAGRDYTINVCNTKTPTNTAETSTLTIEYCNTSTTVNVTVVEDENACLPQGAVYNISANATTLTIPTRCCVESVRETAGVGTVSTVYSTYIQTIVPENNSGSNRTITLLVVYCDGTSANIIINQSNIFEQWRNEETTFCIGKSLYQRQYKYTGTTSSNYVKTNIYRDILVEAMSPDCHGTDDWKYRKYLPVNNDWFCDDANKYVLMRMYVSMDSINWTPTDIYKKGALIEEHSTDCCWDDKWLDYPYSKYVWNGDWICNDGNKYKKYLKYFSMDNITWESSICIYKMDDSADGLIEENSEDCGYIPNGKYHRWRNTSDYICNLGDKYVKQIYQESDDNITWHDFNPLKVRAGALIERESSDCEYEYSYKTDDTYTCELYDDSAVNDFRYEIYDSGGTLLYRQECNGNPVLRNEEFPSEVLNSCANTNYGKVGVPYYHLVVGECINTIDFRYSIGRLFFRKITFPKESLTDIESLCGYIGGKTSLVIPKTVKTFHPRFNAKEDTNFGTPLKEVLEITGLTFEEGSQIEEIGELGSGFYLSNLFIPKTVKIFGGYKRTGSGDMASTLKSITFEENSIIKNIAGGSFSGNTSLTAVTLPNSLETIPSVCFWKCTGLTSVTIPDSVINIEASAFRECNSLANITFGSNVKYIGSYAFHMQGNGAFAALTSVTLPDSVEVIDYGAFANTYLGAGNRTYKKLVTINNTPTSLKYFNSNGDYIRIIGSLPQNLKCVYIYDLTKQWGGGKTGFTIPSNVEQLLGSLEKSEINSGATITSLAVYPPGTNTDSPLSTGFKGTINVPSGSANYYKSHPGWSRYRNYIH